MGSLKLTTASSGSVILSPANTASDVTITVPASTATMAINGPAFNAYLSTNQSISSATFTKIQCNSEVFDTASAYDNATNYRFTPQVAGYYQVNCSAYFSGSNMSRAGVYIYKNGTAVKTGNFMYPVTISDTVSTASELLYLNGSTDYVEFYAYTAYSGSSVIAGSQVNTSVSASLVRAA